MLKRFLVRMLEKTTMMNARFLVRMLTYAQEVHGKDV